MKIIDQTGQERDQAWLLEKFGPVNVSGSSDRYHVAELREIVGPTALTAAVYRANGAPARGVLVTMAWPDGTNTALTNALGESGFPMGSGSWYKPPTQGPQRLGVDGLWVNGLGMLELTNHVHLDITFVEGDESPPVEPPVEPPTPDANWTELFSYLSRIEALLEAM